jgi:hypothetical protein
MNKIIKENGIAISILIFWFFLNFIGLVMADDAYYYAKDVFYPFTQKKFIYAYDITEFLVYGVTPIVVFIMIKLILNEKS